MRIYLKNNPALLSQSPQMDFGNRDKRVGKRKEGEGEDENERKGGKTEKGNEAAMKEAASCLFILIISFSGSYVCIIYSML